MTVNDKLIQNALRLTRPRQKIVNILSLQSRPISFEEYSELDPLIDKSTFYRTMQTFEHVGIISGIESDEGKRYFEITTDAHPHFICHTCRAIICLSDTAIVPLNGYRVESITYKGQCVSCSDT